jgi:nucleotide-binding universal stress UspA family protein
MVKIRNILCPTDFSEFSDWALGLALPLARWYHAEVAVMHVVPRVLMHPEYFPYMQEPVLPASSVREQALEELGRFVQKARAAGISAEVRLEEGDSVEEILECASGLPADMLVMGTHGRRGFERLVLGSVTEKILRKTPCPVLTVSNAPHCLGTPEKPTCFKRILCPIDFSTSSVKALEYALSLAQEADSQLTLLHVVESLFDESLGQGSVNAPDFRAHLEQDAVEKLKEAVPSEARDWCTPEELVRAGRPYQQILKLAEEKNADLIVMGVQGRSAVDLTLFGSTTHHVVRQSPCPVLTMRSG